MRYEWNIDITLVSRRVVVSIGIIQNSRKKGLPTLENRPNHLNSGLTIRVTKQIHF